jgi:biopolymer transport protein TolR
VVFMVTAPLLTVGVSVELPESAAAPIPGQDEPLAVSIDAGGRVFIQDSEVSLETLIPRLQAITQNNPDARIFVRGDKSIDYGRVMEVMGTLNGAGFNRVALITERPREK